MVSTRGVRRGSDKAKHGAGKAKKKGSTPHAGKQSSSSAAPTAGAAQTKRPPPSSSDDDTDAAVPCTADEQFRITPASGRWWKPTYTSRSSAKAVKNKPKKGNTWDRRKNKEKLHRDVVTLQNELVEQKARHLQETRERSEARAKMKEVNERRGEVVVPITNTLKIKNMTRKQVRLLAKR
eukprot:m.178285 g.178285  ORF g.178285 m.178285 type:complete len:180 (+) comp24516_c0_seq1:52-591(+)